MTSITYENIQLHAQEPLARISRLGVGGPADYIAQPCSLEELKATLAFCHENGLSWRVVGACSNILFSDSGFRGCIIVMTVFDADVCTIEKGIAHVSAGMMNARMLHRCAEEGFGGLEFLAAIPGTIGGAVVMNAGCIDYTDGAPKMVGESVAYVDVVDAEGNPRRLMRRDIQFSYRSSSLRDAIVVAVGLRLAARPKDAVFREIDQNVKTKGTVIPWSAKTVGSIFKNPQSVPETAGMLIDRAGLKGLRNGGCRISLFHANVFENDRTGTAKDMWALIQKARTAVEKKNAIRLELEIDCIGDFT